VVDRDPARIHRWNSTHLPVHEPGLHLIVRIARDGLRSDSRHPTTSPPPPPPHPEAELERQPNLFFTTRVECSIAEADVVFLAVNTPSKSTGIGAGVATNLAAFESAVITVARAAKPGAIVVEKSTVPCGTAQTVQAIVSLEFFIFFLHGR
jgi:UDPglucose 6-dehydrogenase